MGTLSTLEKQLRSKTDFIGICLCLKFNLERMLSNQKQNSFNQIVDLRNGIYASVMIIRVFL